MKKLMLTFFAFTAAMSSNLQGTEICEQHTVQVCDHGMIQVCNPVAYQVPVVYEVCEKNALYVGTFGGVNFLQNPNHITGVTGGLAVGYKFGRFISLEVEGAARYSTAHLSNQKYQNQFYTVMGNVYFDFDLGLAWTPYIGAGAGYGYSKEISKNKGVLTSSDFHKKSDTFCYQGMVGIETQASENTRIGFEYRCLATKQHFRDHSALVTVGQYF